MLPERSLAQPDRARPPHSLAFLSLCRSTHPLQAQLKAVEDTYRKFLGAVKNGSDSYVVESQLLENLANENLSGCAYLAAAKVSRPLRAGAQGGRESAGKRECAGCGKWVGLFERGPP